MTRTDLAIEADRRIQTFQADAAREAGIFHHFDYPAYLPHGSTIDDNLAKEYFGEAGMLRLRRRVFSVKRFVRVSPVLSTRIWLVQTWEMITRSTSPVMRH
jgi:isocitrate lyase